MGERGVSLAEGAMAQIDRYLGKLDETVTDADLDRAFAALARREQDGRADPRTRLIDLWSGRRPQAAVKPALAAWKAFLAATLERQEPRTEAAAHRLLEALARLHEAGDRGVAARRPAGPSA